MGSNIAVGARGDSGTGRVGWVKKLDAVHKSIFNDFELESDKQMAADLTYFFNWIIYDQEIGSKDKLSFYMQSILKKNFIGKLKNDTNLRELFSGAGAQHQQGDNAEKGFAQLLDELILASVDGVQRKAATSDSLIVGKKMTSVKIDLTKIPERYLESFKNNLDRKTRTLKQSNDKYYQFIGKQGKDDISTQGKYTFTIVAGLSGEAQRLLNLTASVKSYKEMEIHLERVNKLKAYSAIISDLKDVDEQTANLLYEDYYGNKPRKRKSKNVTEHLNHLISVYALTGKGQVDINEFGQIEQDAVEHFSQYLFYNNYTQRKIYVFSTREIISQLGQNDDGESPFRTRVTSDGKIEVVLKIAPLLSPPKAKN